jgi:hypothetical protein
MPVEIVVRIADCPAAFFSAAGLFIAPARPVGTNPRLRNRLSASDLTKILAGRT